MKGRGQNTSHAVMAQRVEAPDSLDFFPTPPWATRALCEHLVEMEIGLRQMQAWEPACGEGHMARPLEEYFSSVLATDIHDYGAGYGVFDFLAFDTMLAQGPALKYPPNLVVTNPPYVKAEEFALRALKVATTGVALLVRTQFLEGGDRWRDLFDPHPPSRIVQFSERVPMVKGRLDPKASSATAYCWVVWLYPFRQGAAAHPPPVYWLPPGTRERLERKSDYQPVTTD